MSVLLFGGFMTATPTSAATPAFRAVGSAKQVYVTGLAPSAQMSLITPAGQTLKTQNADSLGGLLFLSGALRTLEARVYVSAQESVRFDHDGSSLADAQVWNLSTSFGGLDITYVPAGTDGFSDLAQRAEPIDIGGVTVRVAALEDIVRSKEAAGREKDRVVLPALRRLLDLTSSRRRGATGRRRRPRG